jgi:trimeric autotransporter adhesin
MGNFTLNGVDLKINANHVACWDGSQWHALGNGVSGVNTRVNALQCLNGSLYVGGSFTQAGGRPYPPIT